MKSFFLTICLFFLTARFFPLTELQKAMIADDFKKVSDEKLIFYFIIASGEEDFAQQIMDFYNYKAGEIDVAFAEKMLEDGEFSRSQKLQAEFLFTQMHSTFFKEYNFFSSTIGEIRNAGRYNCVSSSILYAALLLRNHISKIVAVETTDHVLLNLKLNPPVDVETTNIYGFNPGEKRDFHDEFGQVTGFTYVPPTNYSLRTEVSLKKLMSLVCRNRASEYTTKEEFEKAVIQAEIVEKMRSDTMGYEDYIGSVQNLINHYILTKRFSDAITVLQAKMPQNHPQYTRLYDTILFGFIEENHHDGFFAAAFQKAKMISSPDIQKAALNNICVSILKTANEGKNFQAGLSAIALAESFGFSKTEDYRKHRLILVNNICVEYVNASRFKEAKHLLNNELMKHILTTDDLKKLIQTVYTTESAGFFNTGDFATAITITKEGLTYLPEDTILLGNLKLMYAKYLSQLKGGNTEKYAAVLAEARTFFPTEHF